jgi:hypothetical protein
MKPAAIDRNSTISWETTDPGAISIAENGKSTVGGRRSPTNSATVITKVAATRRKTGGRASQYTS